MGPDAIARKRPSPFQGPSSNSFKIHFYIPTKKKRKEKKFISISEPAELGPGLCLTQSPFLNISFKSHQK